MPHYQRARSAEQKAERRQRILDAARRMLVEHLDIQSLSLNELARRTGMAKSNLYRYFESREAVLLELFIEEWTSWRSEVEGGLGVVSQKKDRLGALVALLSQATARFPLMCNLMHALPSVLEHNIGVEVIRAFKHDGVLYIGALSERMHAAVPRFTPQQHAELMRHWVTLVVGTWPLANPSDNAKQAMQDDSLAPVRYNFGADLSRALRLIALGLDRESGGCPEDPRGDA